MRKSCWVVEMGESMFSRNCKEAKGGGGLSKAHVTRYEVEVQYIS